MLLASLQSQNEAATTINIFCDTDDTTGHQSNQFIRAGKQPEVRATIGHVIAEGLTFADDDVRAKFTGCAQNSHRHRIGNHNNQCTYGMHTFDQHLTELVNSGEVAFEVALAASTRPADFELGFRMGGKGRRTPIRNAAIPGQAARPAATPGASPAAAAKAAAAGLPPNPLGTGTALPPMATSPTAHAAVTSPNPLGNDAVFGSGFESLFGG